MMNASLKKSEGATVSSKYNETSKNYTMKYQKENLDQIAIRVPKGKREEYKAKAEAHGKSLARYIMDLIENDP